MSTHRHLGLVSNTNDLDPLSEIATERELIAQAMADEVTLKTVCELLEEKHFHDPKNASIFAALKAVHEQGVAVDAPTVGREMGVRGTLKAAGGLSALSGLAASAMMNPTLASSNIGTHATRLIELHAAREHVMQCRMGAAKAFDPARPVDQTIRETVEGLNDLHAPTESNVMQAHDCFSEMMTDLLDVIEGRKKPNVVRTGFDDHDALTGGVEYGSLVTLGGDPGTGKTSKALQIVNNVASRGEAAMFFSLEVNRKKLARRWACQQSRVSMRDIESQAFEDAFDRFCHAAGEASRLPVFIYKRPALDIDTLRATVREQVRKLEHTKLRLVVIDHLYFCKLPESDNEAKSIAMFTRALKALAEEHQLVIILLAPLKREGARNGGGRPKMSDFKGSSSIESDSDQVWLLYRIANSLPDPDSQGAKALKDRIEIIVAKNREGETGTVTEQYTGQWYRFDRPDEETLNRWRSALSVAPQTGKRQMRERHRPAPPAVPNHQEREEASYGDL